ncbi:MAG: mechanosensitive ion channel family protein, partial [Candidatus Eremiobacteraeota bacterium]|nr:mechanosensitive ion channel family protein [Candidatus Eremiobacteraeota bacterium]
SLRVPTTIRAISGFKSVLIVAIAIFATIAQLGLPIAGVVTFGGVAALAISFAAQNLIRDFLGGFQVIFEDQYAIGDFITANNIYSGIVETLTLRMVQLRDTAGNLITIGHGTVTNVINRSRNWSRVDYRVPVDPSADVENAIAILKDVIEDLAKSPHFRPDILDAIEWIGIDAMSRDWIVLRVSIKTAPLRQFEIRRELNLRVVERFKQAEIKFGAPIADQTQTTQP